MTIRLTVAQATVRFLAGQYSERDGEERRLIPGCFGIFGHGNVAGVGQALLEAKLTGSADLPYYLARIVDPFGNSVRLVRNVERRERVTGAP